MDPAGVLTGERPPAATAADARPLRVLFVISRLEPGGTEGQLTNLILRAHPQRIEARVATLYATSAREHVDPLVAHGVPVHPLSLQGGRLRSLSLALARLPGLVRAFAPDVVYAWLEEAATVAIPVARSLGVPVAVSRRNVCGSAFERFTVPRVAIRRIEAAATLATANSDAVRDEAIRRGIAAERIHVVPNGHDPLTPLEEPPSPPVRLGYLAHLRAEKGHLRLLNALQLLPPELDWHADLAGSGPLERALRGEIARRGLSDRVSLVGVVNSRSFWATHHVAVLLSDHEGSPNTLIDAAMAARAIVATNVPGTSDVVGAAGGVLVPLDDSAAIAAALARVASDPEHRAALGRHAHRQAVKRFSMQRFVDGHIEALEAAAGHRALA
ncbi:MAG TPA: glycosyltransferase [Solirubrobacteraceae bacterium]|jgi:glycosyltransferase involved in cell wall biosynthesis|nr:glycosyltransferase [Solirubrobacteraceae bacterium]